MNAVVVADLHKRYPGQRDPESAALRGVDLSVPAGCVFGLIGANGAGKTTLIKILLDVVRPSAGSVRVLGGSPADPHLRRRVAYLPERLQLPQAWTGLAWLHSVARFKALPRRPEHLRAALERVGLHAHGGQRVRTYSKGMRQRLGLAACLLGGADLLVLDEPTDGLDPLARAEVRRIFAQERGRGATIFINSHLLAEAERVCDRVGIIHRGRMVRQGSLAQLKAATRRWRCRFAPGADAEGLQAAGWSQSGAGETWLIDAADPDGLDGALQRARATGARLVELRPDERDLEQVLTATIAAEGAP